MIDDVYGQKSRVSLDALMSCNAILLLTIKGSEPSSRLLFSHSIASLLMSEKITSLKVLLDGVDLTEKVAKRC